MPSSNYFAIIEADVRYDKRLSSSEKLFYAEITALCNMNGKCWATRQYFANLYKVDKRTISRWTTKLEECGYINIEMVYDEKGSISSRIITIRKRRAEQIIEQPPLDKNVHSSLGTNMSDPADKNVSDNNTLTESNNTFHKNEKIYISKRDNVSNDTGQTDDNDVTAMPLPRKKSTRRTPTLQECRMYAEMSGHDPEYGESYYYMRDGKGWTTVRGIGENQQEYEITNYRSDYQNCYRSNYLKIPENNGRDEGVASREVL
jgi:hypothetical protein